MQYVKVSFVITTQEQSDMLVALLANAGYDGFEESEGELLAYIESPKFHADELKSVAEAQGAGYSTELIPAQNWNSLWESNFPPVMVADFCTIRAHFHDIQVTTPYEILITPKMSFGTGHHATTQLMMLLMKDVGMKGKRVLDFGTGTGVLAILAEMLGAAHVLAIDNDDWCVENAIENAERNNCKNIRVRKGSPDEADGGKYGVILANINRHILLEYMPLLYDKLDGGGTLLMSGLLSEDRAIIISAAVDEGFIFQKELEQGNWIALSFGRI
jgi:ribosomal protein L11 methyltransferase